MGKIVVFSKTNCPHCVSAKNLLSELALPYHEIDITDDIPSRMLMSYVSQQYTVPQIFFNNNHIGGAADLDALGQDTIKALGETALAEAEAPQFLTQPPSETELAKGVLPLSAALDSSIPENWMEQPEHDVVEAWYSEVFGFLGDGYKYFLVKPELATNWMTTFSAIMAVVSAKLGQQWGLACFATAYTSGCAYCSAHGAGFAMIYGQQDPANLADLIRYLDGEAGELDDLPFTEEQLAYINLAAKTTNHLVVEEDIHRLRKAVGIKELGAYTASVAAMGGMMGMLTRQVDMLGLEIEAEFKTTIDNSALGEVWEWGAHDTQEKENLHNIKEVDPSADLAPKLKRLRDTIWEMNTYKREEYDAYPDELLPNWIGSLPDQFMIGGASHLYHSAFKDGELPACPKHLAAYLVTYASGYPNLAAEERRLAITSSGDAALTLQQLAQVEAFAKSHDISDLIDLDEAGVMAIRFAECSISYPNVIPGRLVFDLTKKLKPKQIAELISCVACIGFAQRWTGIWEVYNDYMLKQA
ncbi:MAG: glutaredoxin domain-containing protein [Pseudomonadales bacterium]